MTEERARRKPRRPAAYLALTIGCALVFGASAIGAWWQADARWRPHTLVRHRAEIETLLNQAGWVSPGLSPSHALYMVSFRSCTDCIRFEKEEFPRLHASGVDTRVIVVARRSYSDAPERAGVAELWRGRSWKTYEGWTSIPVSAWTAEGLPTAEADPASAALVEKSRLFIDRIRPLLAENGVTLAYPTLIWRDAEGHLRGCACESRETYRFVRSELGIS